MVPTNLRYATTHEWAKLEGTTCTVGITAFAVEQLTDVVYVELKPAGTKLKAGGSFGEIESVKAVSELYAPIEGEMAEINKDVIKDPASIAADPYGAGWLVKIKVAPGSSVAKLLSAEDYEKQIASQGH
jgi:glycine cleavage system H protein